MSRPSEPLLPSRPCVSVITVVFNGVASIARTIEATLAQDYPDLEYIVVDGGSVDGTKEVVESYGRAIDRFVSEPDQGIYDAMNKGIEFATGEYLVFMNCGDVFSSTESLSRAMGSATHGQEEVLFGRWVRDEGDRGMRPCAPSLENGIFNHQAVIYSRAIHRWHGAYVNVKGFTTADYLFFTSLIREGRVRCTVVDEVLAVIDLTGISAGLQTFAQKQAIDYLCGMTNRWRLAAALVLHPAYAAVKQALRRRP